MDPTGLLAVLFLAAGALKLTKSKDELLENSSMGWTEHFSPGVLKLIGLAEVAGAAGLILPAAFDTATWLVPTAAIGLVLLMVGAAITHLRRKEYANVGVNLVLLGLALFVAIERIGPQSP